MMQHPNLTITFLIEYDSKFLLIARGSDEENFPSMWAFPGGKVELGETVIDTIRREVKEETGLEILDETVLLDTYTFKTTVGLAFLVRAKHENLNLSNEIADYAWVKDIKELEHLKCIPGIHNHLVRAKLAIIKGYFESMEELNLTKEKYLNL